MSNRRAGFRRRVGAVALGFAATFVSVEQSYAQSLFEYLFGGGISPNEEYRRERERQRRQQNAWPDEWTEGAQPRAKPKPIAKVSAPSYYTYRADALVPVKVPAAKPAAAPGALPQLVLDGVRFDEAMASAADFQLSAEKDVSDAIARHYAADPRFIWISGYSLNGRAEQALRVLGDAASHGLDPSDYAVAVPAKSFAMDNMTARQKELAEFELALSARVLRYVRDAERGRR